MMVRAEKAGKRRRKLKKGRSLGKEKWLVFGQMINLTHKQKRRKKADEIEWREITNEEEMLEWRQKEDGKKKNRQKKCGGDRNLNMDGRQVNVPTYMLFILYLQPRHISLNLIRRHP